jgi:hypothetical protein
MTRRTIHPCCAHCSRPIHAQDAQALDVPICRCPGVRPIVPLKSRPTIGLEILLAMAYPTTTSAPRPSSLTMPW